MSWSETRQKLLGNDTAPTSTATTPAKTSSSGWAATRQKLIEQDKPKEREKPVENKQTHLMTALSTGKTSGTEQAGESADLKGILKGAVTGARATQPKTDFKPINTNKENVFQSRSETEQFVYDLAQKLTPENPTEGVGGFTYPIAKLVGGVVSLPENAFNAVKNTTYSALSNLASLGGKKPNAVSEWLAEGVTENKIGNAYQEGMNDKLQVQPGKFQSLVGGLYENAPGLIGGGLVGKAVSGLTKANALSTGVNAGNIAKLFVGTQASGQAMNEALQAGATKEQAALYGNAIGAIEVASESLAGGVPGLGKGVIDDFLKIAKKTPGAVKGIIDVMGEGFEEDISEFAAPYLKRAIYDPSAKNASLTDLAEAFASGSLMSAVAQGGNVISSAANGVANKLNKSTAKSNVTTPQTSTQNAANNVDVPTTIAPNGGTKVNATQNAVQAPTIAPNLQRVVSPVSTENATQGNVVADAVKNSGDAETHIDNRTMNSVKARKTNSFQYDHPELHQYFEYSADLLSMEVENQMANDFMRPAAKKGSAQAARVGDRYKAKGAVKTLMDAGLTKPQILQSLQDIKNDHGSENYAAAKRVELVLDDMMTNGYAAYTGDFVPAIDEYVKAKQSIEGAKTNEQRQAEYDEAVDFIEGTPSTSLFPENSLGAKITTPKSNATAESSVGAATGGFVPQTPYSAWSENTENGQFHDVGENAVRSVDLPKINLQGESTMKTAATVMESQNTPDARVAEIQSAMVDGKMAYVPIENKSVAEKASAKIERDGWQTALNDWTSNVRSGKVSPDLVAEGATLLNNAGNATECTKEAYINLLTDYANLVHASGQSLQAARILKTLTPEARLYAMQRSVQKINEGINEKSGAKKRAAKTADENAKAVSDEITDEVVKKVRSKTTSKKSADEKTDIDRAAEQLASKVDSTTKARKPVEVNAINDMVNELFKSAKESPLPEKAALAKRSPIEFLTQAIKNKSEYAETWNSAKEILLEKYADNQPVLDMLNDYFKKGIVPAYSDATLTSSVKQAIKDLDTKLSDIKELSWADRQKAIKAITNYLVEQTGAVDGDAKALRRDAADKITMLIIDSAPKLTQKQKLEIKQATQDAMRNHGVPLESWEEETGRLLSENLSKRLDAPKTPKPAPMTKTILNDLVKFAEEHALPSRQIAPKLNRTAAARITDFFNNRSFYAKAWNEAQKVMREKYADNQEVLDQFDEWLNSTIGYNADGTNAVMQKAIMDAAIGGDISLKQIRNNKALGNTDSVINSIYSKLAAEVKPEGADAITLKDAVTRFVTEKTAKVDSDAQLERFIRSALKDINAKFSSVVGKPSAEKTAMQKTVTDMLIQKYGIDKADAAIVSKTISEKFDEMFLAAMNEHTEIKINADLAEKYRKATTDEERDAIVSEIQQDIADQVPSSGLDKWTALRYVNMLGNFKTQARNVAGNATMIGVTKLKNEVAAGLEHAVSAVSGGKFERTKSFVVSKDMYSAAYADFKNVQKAALGEGKYNESNSTNEFERGINEKRTIFKVNGEWGTKDGSSAIAKGARSVTDVGMKVLEGYRKITNQAMEVGDVVFSRIAYADALAGYLKAHNVTAEQVRNGEVDIALMDKARLYAIQEAQEATFRDTNAFSKAVSTFDSNWGKGGKIISKGILPFRKTPANIAVRAEEYSPLGVINTAVKAVQKAKGNENVSGADVINSLSKTLTGSGILMLGWTLRAMGLLFGKDDDENQSAFNSLTGRQNYSITLPNGTSFTVDWLTPGSMPLFVGANLYDLAAENGLKANDIESVITSITDPIIKMSMMAGVNDALSNIKYSDNNLMQFTLSSAASYLTQGLTNTMLGQIERTSEKVRMSTYTDPTSLVPDWIQRIGGKASAKTPGVDYNQGEYVDAWGRTQNTGTIASKVASNFFNPAYTSTINETALDKELQRLYDATGESSVVPKRVTDKSFKTYDGEYAMAPSEQVKFQKTRGQYAYKELGTLTKSADYKAMSDSEKVKAVSDVYSDATANAKQTIVEARGKMYIPNETVAEKIESYASAGITQKQAYSLNKAIDALDVDKSTNEGKRSVVKTIGQQGYTDKQEIALVGTLYTTHDEDGNVSKSSLLPYLNTSKHLVSLYLTNKDSEMVSMTIPASFSSKSIEYELTDKEKELFKTTYAAYFNSRATNITSADAIKKLRDKAYDAAKTAVIKSRNS